MSARDELAAWGRMLAAQIPKVQGYDALTRIEVVTALWTAEHGRLFSRRGVLPPGAGLGEYGKCFANAQRLVKAHGLRYVEGFAGPTPMEKAPLVLHAWNADHRGAVIDPTWGDDQRRQRRYVGCVFTELPEGEGEGNSLIVELLGGKMLTFGPLGEPHFVDAPEAWSA